MRRLLTIVLCWACVMAADPSARELFERARMLADENQNFGEAIRLFGQVVQLARAEQELAAQARYRQGILYERLGRKSDAERAFESVIREFPAQTKVVAMARSRLPAGALQPEMGNHRIWFGPDVDSFGAPSPDGRYLSFTDWSTGDLAIRYLPTHENRRITHKGLPWSESGSQALWSVFSPDGSHIAYTWLENDEYEIRIAGLRPSQPRILYRGGADETLRVADWSPDGKYILTEQRTGDAADILLVAVADGRSRRLSANLRNCFACGRMLFSKDSRFIVYDVAAQEIFSTALAGNRAESLLTHPAKDALIGWEPDGTHLMFSSDRSGKRRLWSVAVTNGRATSQPQPVWPDIDIGDPLGITRNGSLYYDVSTAQSEIYTADIDLARETVTSPPRVLSARYAGSKRSPAWSADGKLLAYLATGGGNKIVMVNPENGEEHEIVPRGAAFSTILSWTPENILGHARPNDGPFGIYQLSLDNGSVTAVAKDVFDKATFSAYKKRIYYGGDAIFARDLESGVVTTLYRPADPKTTRNPCTALSPDGKWLAIQLRNQPHGGNTLAILPESGGQPRLLFTFRETLGSRSLNWTPDSRRILYSTISGDHSEIWIMDAHGGSPKRIGIGMRGRIPNVRLNRDGKRLAFIVTTQGEEIWVLEHFLGGTLR